VHFTLGSFAVIDGTRFPIVFDQGKPSIIAELRQIKQCSIFSPTCHGFTLAQAFATHWQSIWTVGDVNPTPGPQPFTPVLSDQLQHAIQNTFSKCPRTPTFSFTLSAWLNALKRTKLTTAAGPDGLLLQDFLAMPTYVHQLLVDIFNHMLTTKQLWPEGMTDCLITVLKKVQAPSNLSDYRPLSIYNLLYRLWGKTIYPAIISWLCIWINTKIIK
jgi:hypothetical protein